MKIKEKTSRFFETKNLITVNLIAWSVAYLLIKCDVSLYRLCSSVVDLGKSLYFWFLKTITMFSGSSETPPVSVSVNDIPKVDIQRFIPFDIDEFMNRLSRLHVDIIDVDNLMDFNFELCFFLYQFIIFGLFFAFILMFVVFISNDFLTTENEKPNGAVTDSYYKLQVFAAKYIRPVYVKVRDYIIYFKSRSLALFLFCFIWLASFNVLTFVIEFFAYYFYFLAAFDIPSLLIQLYKLILDSAIMLDTVPLLVWIIIVVTAFCVYSINTGLDRLRHGEAKNCGVVKAFSIVILICGDMGLGKTALATDISLSANNIQKTDSQNILFKYDMLFPFFSWELFEKEIQKEISSGRIYNPPTAIKYVDRLESFYTLSPEEFCPIFNFDPSVVALSKNDGTRDISLFDAMREYAKAYFVYTCENPNLANYSIRLDGYHDDSPYFKKWCGDFFKPDKSKSKYCHILDQDIMRLGKLVEPNNPQAGSFSFGIYNNTEWGKSRLNQVNSEGIKKDAEETNQKNDLYDYLVKLVRHASVMIDNKVFFRFIADEQRPESIPASLRDVVTVINIVSKSELKNSLPGFFVMDALYDAVYEPMKKTYYEYRNKRGDRSAFTLIMKTIISAFSNFYLKVYNNFGYYDLELEAESGRAYGNQGESVSGAQRYTYQLAIKKIYSERYSTDCYQQFFEKRQLESAFGINNYPCYSGLKMTVDEMQQQHDYFLMEIMDIMLGEKELEQGDPVVITSKTKHKKQSFYKNVVDDDDCDNFF